MTRDFLHINDFVILVEEGNSDIVTIDSCTFDEPLIAVAFYGMGNVTLNIKYDGKEKAYKHSKGLALSFYADEKVEFVHTVSANKPLECILIATSPRNLSKLPHGEGELFAQMLNQLVNPSDHYVQGPKFYMTPEMQSIVNQMFHSPYEGKTKMMFFRSQVTALLSHFFGQLALQDTDVVKNSEKEKLIQAKEILSQNLDAPPSLSELSKQIGVNSFKLKKNFKAYFGVPVFKYLQNERLSKAHDLLRHQEASVQEAAWQVGYDSLSSFSNAFAKKYGFRPSEIRS